MPKNIWAATGIKVQASPEDNAGETDLLPDQSGFVTIPEGSEVSGRFNKKTLEKYLEQGTVTTTEPPKPGQAEEDAVSAAAVPDDVEDSPWMKTTVAVMDEFVADQGLDPENPDNDYPASGKKIDKVAWLEDHGFEVPQASEDD